MDAVKTAISIPDDLFQAAEAAAKRLGISRGRLYARAVESYLKTHGARAVTEALDEVYSDLEAGSNLDPELARMQSASIGEDDWECDGARSGGLRCHVPRVRGRFTEGLFW